jgi:hypothetical protein
MLRPYDAGLGIGIAASASLEGDRTGVAALSVFEKQTAT